MPRSKKVTAKKFIGCTLKELPKDRCVEAAKEAIRHNPVNAPARSFMTALSASVGVTAMEQAVLTQKKWNPSGVKLTVGFFGRPSVQLRVKILSHMNAWNEFCSVSFLDVPDVSTAQVRISLGRGGYYSYLGTDILQIPKNQQTMNLEGFSLQTPESEYRRVVRHETGHCLSGDTLIDCPRDLTKHPLGIPIRDLVGTRPWVYAWRNGKMTISKADRVWLSKCDAPVVRVKLRPGRGHRAKDKYMPPQELVGTPDHPVLLADGQTWRNLGDLRPGDRLCSLYRSSHGKRSAVTWTGMNKPIPEHVLVATEVNGPRPEGHHCHHVDENMLNQSPDNLQWKEVTAHHHDHHFGKPMSAQTRARMKMAQEARVGWKHKEETIRKMKERPRPPMTEEGKRKVSEQFKGKKQSEELVAKRTEAMRRFYTNGGKSGMFGKKASEETRRKRSESMKATLARKKQLQEVNNHVVVSVEDAGTQDVYDMSVPGPINFIANGTTVSNSLGFPHEHMLPEIVARLDPQKTIRYFMATQGWSEQEVVQQVLTPLRSEDLTSIRADPTAIMCYQLPGGITKDGNPIPGGNDINAADAAFAASIYPKATQPPVVPPPQGSLVDTVVGYLAGKEVFRVGSGR